MQQPTFEIIESQRGKPQILHASRIYRQRTRRPTATQKAYDTITWKCSSGKNLCQATLITDIHMSTIISSNQCHREDCLPKTVKAQQYRKVYGSVKRKATEDISETPDKLVTKKLRATTEKDKLGTKDSVNLKQSVYRERNKDIPHKLPKNMNDLFDQMEDVKDRPAFMTGSKTHNERYIYPFSLLNILFITSITNLIYLCDAANEHFLGDGTYSYCPQLFMQLYTIHVYRAGYYIPLVHVALPGQTEEIYDHMWRLLGELCLTQCGKVLNIKSLLVDYEKAAINSAYRKFPGITITGCRFHLSQAWFRWIQTYKGFDYLSHYNDNNSEVGKWLRTFFGLSFLPPSMIEEAFLLLQSLKPSSDCDAFADYILDNYIGDLTPARFPPELWAREVTDTRDVRTTNGPEAFHMVYNSAFFAKHPNIYKVLFALLLSQEKRYLIFNDLNEGLTKPQANPQLNKDQRVRNEWEKFVKSDRTDEDLRHYLSALGNRYKGKKI